MDDIIVVDNYEFPCRVDLGMTDKAKRLTLTMEISYGQAKQLFVDSAHMRIYYDKETYKDLTEYKLVKRIIDNCDGTITIIYDSLSDLEKLIELHYGGVN